MIIGSKVLPLPILQGGMGTISAALCGLHEKDFETDPRGASLRALHDQIVRAKERAAVKGDWENGLFFCGANAGRKTAITSVADEMAQIMDEWRKAQ